MSTHDKFPNVKSVSADYQLHRSTIGMNTMVARCMKALRPIRDQFDALYVTGLSGEVPGAVLSYLWNKDLIVLRKQDAYGGTGSHGTAIEGDAWGRIGVRYVILDDFCANGGTLGRLMDSRPRHGILVGICLYGHPRGEREIEAGYAKGPIAEGNYCSSTVWKDNYLVRRGATSMLFDFTTTKPLGGHWFSPLSGKQRMANKEVPSPTPSLDSQPTEPMPF
jgi:adenine/guanine phosphoribosyltransferase-like PRPP-binding protein